MSAPVVELDSLPQTEPPPEAAPEIDLNLLLRSENVLLQAFAQTMTLAPEGFDRWQGISRIRDTLLSRDPSDMVFTDSGPVPDFPSEVMRTLLGSDDVRDHMLIFLSDLSKTKPIPFGASAWVEAGAKIPMNDWVPHDRKRMREVCVRLGIQETE